MVACSDDDGQLGEFIVKLHEEIVEKLFHMDTRLLDVEHVAAHHESVGGVGFAPVFKLAEEMAVFIGAAVVLIENLTEMQVGSVKNAHKYIFKFKGVLKIMSD